MTTGTTIGEIRIAVSNALPGKSIRVRPTAAGVPSAIAKIVANGETMQLFMKALHKEVARLHHNQIRLRVIGDMSRFDPELVRIIRESEEKTAGNRKLELCIAANYGGRWDIANAVSQLMHAHPERRDGFSEEEIAELIAGKTA